MSQSLPPLTFSNSIWHPRQASGESQGPELAPKGSGLLSARRGTWTLSQGLGRQGKFGAGASQLRRLHSGAGGAGSKQARLDGRDKGLLVRRRPPPPHKSPSGRRRRRRCLPQGRKHFLIPEASTHGCRGWRPPPAATQLGTRAGKGALSRYSHSWGLSPQSFPPLRAG